MSVNGSGERRGGAARVAGAGAILVLAASASTASPAAAQSAPAYEEELPPILAREREIALARSAAPPQVSADATVLVLERGRGYVEAVHGTSGVTCYVSRSRAEALEPHCFDAEGSATILRMALRRAELREVGRTREEIEREIASGLAAGRFRIPSRPAMSYMLSPAQDLYADDGRHVGQWKPHLMIYYPYLTAADLGLAGPPSTTAAVVVDEGLPTANIMVVVQEFAEYADPVAKEAEDARAR